MPSELFMRLRAQATGNDFDLPENLPPPPAVVGTEGGETPEKIVQNRMRQIPPVDIIREAARQPGVVDYQPSGIAPREGQSTLQRAASEGAVGLQRGVGTALERLGEATRTVIPLNWEAYDKGEMSANPFDPNFVGAVPGIVTGAPQFLKDVAQGAGNLWREGAVEPVRGMLRGLRGQDFEPSGTPARVMEAAAPLRPLAQPFVDVPQGIYNLDPEQVGRGIGDLAGFIPQGAAIGLAAKGAGAIGRRMMGQPAVAETPLQVEGEAPRLIEGKVGEPIPAEAPPRPPPPPAGPEAAPMNPFASGAGEGFTFMDPATAEAVRRAQPQPRIPPTEAPLALPPAQELGRPVQPNPFEQPGIAGPTYTRPGQVIPGAEYSTSGRVRTGPETQPSAFDVVGYEGPKNRADARVQAAQRLRPEESLQQFPTQERAGRQPQAPQAPQPNPFQEQSVPPPPRPPIEMQPVSNTEPVVETVRARPTEPEITPAPAARAQKAAAENTIRVDEAYLPENQPNPIGAMEAAAAAERPAGENPFTPRGPLFGPDGELIAKPVQAKGKEAKGKKQRGREKKSPKEEEPGADIDPFLDPFIAEGLNTTPEISKPELTSPIGKGIMEQYPRIGGALGQIKSKTQMVAAKFMNPQYTGFYKQTGMIDALRRAGQKYIGNKNRLVQETTGFDPVTQRVELREMMDKITEAEKAAGPEVIYWKVKRRMGLQPSQAEQAFMDANPEAVRLADNFYRQLDRARELGMPEGDLGPLYYPIHAKTLGQLLKALGPEYKRVLRDPIAREKLLSNFERQRTGDHRPGTYLVDDVMNYLDQMAQRDSTRPLNRKFVEMAQDYKARGRGFESELVTDMNNKNLNREMARIDTQALDKVFQKIAEEPPPVPGETFKSSGIGSVLPEGDVRVLSELLDRPGEYRVEVNGKQFPRSVSEVDIAAAKHPELINGATFTDAVNKINMIGAGLGVGFRWMPGIKAVVGNIGRLSTMAVEENGFANLKEGLKNSFGDALTPERLRTWDKYGINRDAMRQVTDNPADVASAEGIKKWAFAAVMYPDLWAQRIAFESRAAGLRRAHPDWGEARILDKSAEWAQLVTDINIESTRAPMMYHPLVRTIYLFKAPGLRTAQLAFKNAVVDGNWEAAAVQIGTIAAMTYAVVKAAGGGWDDFAEALVEQVPFLSDLQYGDSPTDMAAPTMMYDVGKKTIKGIAKGEPEKVITSTPLGRDVFRLATKGQILKPLGKGKK